MCALALTHPLQVVVRPPQGDDPSQRCFYESFPTRLASHRSGTMSSKIPAISPMMKRPHSVDADDPSALPADARKNSTTPESPPSITKPIPMNRKII